MCEYLFGLRKPCEVLPSRDRLYRPSFSVCCHSERCLTTKPCHAQQSKATRVHNLPSLLIDGVKQAGKGGGSLCQTKSVWPSSLNKNETPMNKKEHNRVHEQVASRLIVTGLVILLAAKNTQNPTVKTLVGHPLTRKNLMVPIHLRFLFQCSFGQL